MFIMNLYVVVFKLLINYLTVTSMWNCRKSVLNLFFRRLFQVYYRHIELNTNQALRIKNLFDLLVNTFCYDNEEKAM